MAAAPPAQAQDEAIDEDEYLNETLLKSPEQQNPQTATSADPDEAARRTQLLLTGRLSSVAAPALPVNCSVKSLGSASATGISGVANVRAPIDRLARVAASRRLARRGSAGGVAAASTLPLVRLNVLQHGLGIDESSGQSHVPSVFYPIESISYAAMDTRMPRIFCFISVEISAGRRAPVNPTCHAFLCHSVEACYRLVLAVTTAFNSAVNRSKAAAAIRRRIPRPAPSGGDADGAASADLADGGAQLNDGVVHLAFTGDYEEA